VATECRPVTFYWHGQLPGVAVRLGADFDEFVQVSSGPLLRTGYLLAGDRGHAEDLLQETLLRVARHWRTARRAPESYARRVLINLAKDRWRALARHPAERLFGDAGCDVAVADRVGQSDDRRVIAASFRLLPEQQRAVAVLRLWEGLSVTETADLLQISEGTVKSYTARAVTRLRVLLADPAGAS
jgi:RNA polymerase sigma-70 factor (sigma-E family)